MNEAWPSWNGFKPTHPSWLLLFFLNFFNLKTYVKRKNIHIPSNITLLFSWKWAVTSNGY